MKKILLSVCLVLVTLVFGQTEKVLKELNITGIELGKPYKGKIKKTQYSNWVELKNHPIFKEVSLRFSDENEVVSISLHFKNQAAMLNNYQKIIDLLKKHFETDTDDKTKTTLYYRGVKNGEEARVSIQFDTYQISEIAFWQLAPKPDQDASEPLLMKVREQ
ncbi:hypothetical protein [Riemerella columbina]|uniref:hypothetical protein n=1 Tax=Riemerella columbina TaxID=103810 RepID=UPI00266FE8D8|nr:hypothetical protein [Riemerella columbina]WKS94500.1 hypothetical protein NYR17_06040 [Riemerella columbina]